MKLLNKQRIYFKHKLNNDIIIIKQKELNDINIQNIISKLT